MLREKLRTTYDAYKAKLSKLRQTEHGSEIPDDVPLSPPVGYIKQPSLVEQIRLMVRSEKLRQEAEAAGAETFEEADDFDIEDDPEPVNAYEYEPQFDPPYTRFPEAPPPPPAPPASVAPGASPPAPVAGQASDSAIT